MSNTTKTVHPPISLQSTPADPTRESRQAEIQKKIAEIGIGNQEEQLKRIHQIIKLYNLLEDYQKIEQYGRMLLNQANKWKDLRYAAMGHNAIAWSYNNTGQYEKAILHYEKYFVIAQKLENTEMILLILSYLGFTYSRLGNYKQALQYFQEQNKIIEKEPEKEEYQVFKVQNLTNIGRMYLLLEDNERALPYFKKAKKYIQKPSVASLVPIHVQVTIFEGLGKVYLNLQKLDLDLALDSLNQFKDLAMQAKQRKNRFLHVYYMDMYKLYTRTQKPQKALSSLHESLKYTKHSEENFCETMIKMGDCYHTMGNFQKASDHYEKALKMKEKIPKFSLMDLYGALQKNYLALGEYKLAYEFLEKHTQLKEEIMGGKTQKSIAELEKKVEIEREAKERINAEMKALRAQINPHFFFNTLNSIQHYIAQNQSEDAQRFLADFAALMRQTLDNSETSLVPVEKEFDFIRSYLSLEQLRFEQKFDFQIDIDEEADIEALQMPPMLLQPYLENAILHGIQPKEGKGFIQVTLTEEANYLHISITDNGIGRAAAAIRKKQRLHSHKSMGTQIQNNRLKTINALYDQTIEVQTSDVTNKLEEVCGTQVVLKIPIWEV